MNSLEQPTQTNTRSIVHQLEIDAPVEKVWEAIATAEGLMRWFPIDAKVTPGEGGNIWTAWGDAYAFDSPITVWEPNKHLQQVWPEHDVPGSGPGVFGGVDFFLESHGSTTTLRLVHFGFSGDASWDAMYDGTARGWRTELWNLQEYCNHHVGEDRAVVFAYKNLAKDMSAYEAWERLTTAGAFVERGTLFEVMPGERFECTTRSGEQLSGIVRTNDRGYEVTAKLDQFDGALLNIRTDNCTEDGSINVTLWLAAWGEAGRALSGIEQKWKQTLETIYG